MSGLSVVVVGDSQCGKTQLINRFANGAFDQVNMTMVMVVLMNVDGGGGGGDDGGGGGGGGGGGEHDDSPTGLLTR